MANSEVGVRQLQQHMEPGKMLVIGGLVGACFGFICGLIAFRKCSRKNRPGLGIAALIAFIVVGAVFGGFLGQIAATVRDLDMAK